MSNEKTLKKNKRLFYLDGIACYLGGGMMQTGTVITYMVSCYMAGNTFIIGLLSTVVSVAQILPKLFVAKWIMGKEKDTPIVAYLMLGKSLLWVVMGLILLWFNDKYIVIMSLLIILGINWTIIGAGNTILTDTYGKLIPDNMRGNFFGYKEMLSKLAGVIAAIIGKYVLKLNVFPYNFGYLFILVGLIQAIEYIVLKNVEEYKLVRCKKVQPAKKYIKNIKHILKKDKNLLFLIIQDNIEVIGVCAFTFSVLYAKKFLSLTADSMMILTALSMIGASVFAPIFGKVSDTRGCKFVIIFGRIIYIISYIMLFFLNNVTMFYIVYTMLGIAAAADSVTKGNMYIKLGGENNRALYESLRNVLVLPVTICIPMIMGIYMDIIGFKIIYFAEIIMIILSSYILHKYVTIEEKSNENLELQKAV